MSHVQQKAMSHIIHPMLQMITMVRCSDHLTARASVAAVAASVKPIRGLPMAFRLGAGRVAAGVVVSSEVSPGRSTAAWFSLPSVV